jgi:phage shock protein A
MGIIRSVGLLMKSGARAILAPAPDPRQTFAYAYQHQRELLSNVRAALVELAASKDRLQANTLEVERKLPQLQDQAKAYLLEGQEDLARLVLQRRQVATIELQTLREQVDDVEQEERRLTAVEQRLATRIEAFFARREVIAARYSAAEAQVRVNEALGNVSQELADLGTAMQKAEERTENMQARALALDELVDGGVLAAPATRAADAVDRELSKIDVDRVVDSQLTALRREVLTG